VGIEPPSGTVTFVFTDIEGSTRRWEDDPEAMRAALVAHDEVLSGAIDAHRGWLFKHTGDGVCAAFGSARAAIDAAVEAQRRLKLPVRMGIATGEAERRGDDYFGPVLNRTARVMAAGHGGQILVAASTASVVSAVELLDRGEHHLRDLSGVEHLYQARADGLRVEFPPLRTLEAAPGNLPVQTTSFIGRDVAVKELCELLRAHRLVTLTGVGGVGKTRLALQVAGEMTGEFVDGVWLVELAPVGDPAAVPDAVAAVLGVTPQAGMAITASVTQALAGRRMLLVVDNCEHVLDAAADIVEQLLAHTGTVKVIATSREGMRIPAEHLWSVPSLDVAEGVRSAAVELFVERAQAAASDFDVHDEVASAAAWEICRRLDGIALAIELAAARIVAMSPSEVLERLTDRFRLLSGSRRGLERHQTLRQAVQWSYDLLSDGQREVLCCCSVFAGGFDLAAATVICGRVDEYEVLDLLESLVRKSLVVVERVDGHTRYGLLETIRQFSEERLAATGTSDEVRDRHARYFAGQAIAHWDVWEGPGYDVAVEWLEVEFANLRAGSRWAADHADLVTATGIAAHATMLGFLVQRYEPVGWTEEILQAATAAEVEQLPRLYTAAAICIFTGYADAGVGYAQIAVTLADDRRYDGFTTWDELILANAHLYTGRVDLFIETYSHLAAQPTFAHVHGLCGLLYMLPVVGRTEEARSIIGETQAAARAHGNPNWIAWALAGSGRALASADPAGALKAVRQGLAYTREHRMPYFEGFVAREAAALEAVHGTRRDALALFDTTIDSFHRTGNIAHVAYTLAYLAVFFDRDGLAEIAATLYGTSIRYGIARIVMDFVETVDHIRTVLGDDVFDQCVATGSAMEPAAAVRYARDQIQTARSVLEAKS
jgi:predicted ATPase/class 3 adenylate cyclase